LNTYYFITAFIGLWHWRRDKANLSNDNAMQRTCDDVVVLNRLTAKTILLSAAVVVCGVPALSYGMAFLYETGLLGENPMSLLDSSVAVLSAVATWWLVKAYREQWLLWILADTLSVLLCAMQGMWWMAALYLAYVAAAVYGLYYWKKAGVYLLD
jgi:nicotinamide mononucleotide transporter